jgi:hypothetical protein
MSINVSSHIGWTVWLRKFEEFILAVKFESSRTLAKPFKGHLPIQWVPSIAKGIHPYSVILGFTNFKQHL